MANYYKFVAGIADDDAYLVSGKPFISGSITAPGNTGSPIPVKIEFPAVTRWVRVVNSHASLVVRFGFSSGGMLPLNSNYGTVPPASSTPPMEMKITEIYLMADRNTAMPGISVIAGLTAIPTGSIVDNWSGSIGVG